MDVNIHPIIDQLMRPRYHYALKCFDAEDRAPKVPAQPLRYSQVHAWEKKRNTYRYINIDKSISKYRTPCNHNICMNVIWIIITIYILYKYYKYTHFSLVLLPIQNFSGEQLRGARHRTLRATGHGGEAWDRLAPTEAGAKP